MSKKKKEVDVNKVVNEELEKQSLINDVKAHRELIKRVAKEVKINPLEVEYFVVEMGFCLIIGTMQGKRDEMLQIMEDKINSIENTKKIREKINEFWESGMGKDKKGMKIVK